MSRPQVIFLDAVGTLFGVRGSVGQIYSDIALAHGVTAEAAALNRAFFKAFKAAPRMTFPGIEPTQIPAQEYAWWYAIAEQTFAAVGAEGAFSDFDRFFADLYAHFAQADPWEVYGDTLSSLSRWQGQGIELGLISNFDSRIYGVLEALGLKNFFQSVTISSEAGAAKPEPMIFTAALKKHGCSPEAAWHVGDSYREDFEGAKAVGMNGIWLKRSGAN
ncbi:hydrolase [filamentous cyanobacterium CCP5]|nr:hydrolase [filamentous cyanobacterium CCP5]